MNDTRNCLFCTVDDSKQRVRIDQVADCGNEQRETITAMTVVFTMGNVTKEGERLKLEEPLPVNVGNERLRQEVARVMIARYGKQYPWMKDDSFDVMPTSVTYNIGSRITCLIFTLLTAVSTFALTETVDGVTWTYSVVDGEAAISGATLSQSSSITVPTEINGYTVTKIGSNAFYGNTQLRGVTIPGSVISVGEKAFSKCSSLASVVFLEGVQSIGNCGFQYCGSLKTITIPVSLTNIAAKTFSECPAIERVNVDSVESYMNIEFGSGSSTPLFSGIACLYTNGVKIVDLVIPSGTMQIKACAFNGQGMLQSIAIPRSVTNIGSHAFDNLQSLTRIIFDSDIGTVYVDYQGQNLQNAQAEVEPKVGYVFKGWVDDMGAKVENPFLASESIAISPFWQRLPTISNLTARQRYPWNGKVDITFEVVGDMTARVPESSIPVLTLSATDSTTGTKYIASESALSGDIGTAEGMHHLVWDLSVQNIEFKSDEVVFSVTYVEPQYCVVDLSAGAKAPAYPVSYLADVPPGGWTDEYKTSKLVLRRIAPGSFKSHGIIQYGSQYLNNQAYDVTLTKPYFIGAFEVTQRQYELVTGEKPSYFTNRTYYATRPVDCVSYDMIRGASAGAGWPGSSAVDASSFMGKLRSRTQIDGFDLPTDAQWEYACRAGTTTDYNNGKDMTGESNDVNLNEVGRYQANLKSPVNRNRNTSYGTAKVGSYLPNAWGLYDMHGNVDEWCLDWHRYWYPSEYMTGVTDPDGLSPIGGDSRIFRGGSWLRTADYCTSSSRNGSTPSSSGGEYGGIGFRIVRTLSNVEVESYSELNWADVACSGNSSVVAIDSRIGVRESLGNETITYSSLWNESGGATVTIEQDGVVLAEDLAGSGELTWRVNYDGIFTLTHTTYTNGIAGERLSAKFVVDRVSLDPLIIEPNGGEFANVSQTISLSCATDGAKIYYTTDGSDPRTNGCEYTKPFTVYKSCIVRAVSSIDGWMEYPEATATFSRTENLSEAANFYGYTMETDGDANWVVDTDVSHDGVSSVRSGTIGNNGTTYLLSSVKKAGTVSFWWKAQCEEADEEDGEDGYYDYGVFLVDGVAKARIAGNDTGWCFVSVDVPTGGKHTLRWEYRKDGVDSYQPDCVWLDQVQWIPADGSGFTMTTPEPVPYSWLSGYGLGVSEGDFEAAANAASGKAGEGGAPLRVWQDYVAGTDPTNATSRFTAKIEMADGAPVVTWEPNLNTNGVIRAYKVFGKENLTDPFWSSPTNSLHRFFKVSVELP